MSICERKGKEVEEGAGKREEGMMVREGDRQQHLVIHVRRSTLTS